MAITKKLDPEESEKVKAFVNGGQESYKSKAEFTNVLFRIPISILEKVDAKVKEKAWMNRTQWIMEAIEAKLDEKL